jgi:hypothetical protein
MIITYDASGDPIAVGPGTDGQVLTSTGAGSPPAFENLPASGAALTGSTNNTITTVTGANAIQGEANLTFDGTNLDAGGSTDSSNGIGVLRTKHHTTSNNPVNVIGCVSGSGYNNVQIGGNDTSFSGTAATAIRFYTGANATTANGTLRGYWDGSGNLGISDGNLVIGTAGHGIDFSATSGTGTSELLDDYEKGTFTPTASFASGGTPTYTTQQGVYTKIGDVMHAWGLITFSSVSGCSGGLRITLPETASEVTLTNQHMGTIWFIVGLNYNSYGNYGIQVGVNGTVGDVYAFASSTGNNYAGLNASSFSDNTMLKYQLTYKLA